MRKQFAAPHDQAGNRIKGAEWFIEEEHIGIYGESASNFQAAVSCRPKVPLGRPSRSRQRPNHFECSALMRLITLVSRVTLEEAEPDVSFDREPRKDATLLKHEDAPGVRTAHNFAIDFYFAAGRR